MKYRQIETSFWEDNYILDLTHEERQFFIYLFTNKHVNMCGLYELHDKTICYTLGYSQEQLDRLKDKLSNDHKYYFYKGWVYIVNFSEHNKYSYADNVVNAYVREFNSIPVSIKEYFFETLSLVFIPSISNYSKFFDLNNGLRVIGYRLRVKEGTPYPTPYPRNNNGREPIRIENEEKVNVDDIPF